MKVIQLFKNRIEKRKQQRQQFIKKWLYAYYCRFYEARDYGKIALPYFIVAEKKVNDLESRGLLEITYNQIKQGVKIAC